MIFVSCISFPTQVVSVKNMSESAVADLMCAKTVAEGKSSLSETRA